MRKERKISCLECSKLNKECAGLKIPSEDCFKPNKKNSIKKKKKDDNKFYHVYTTSDGIKLYAKENIDMCCCNGSLHVAGFGCL